MEVCSNGHEEIVYADHGFGRPAKCPLCEALEEIADLKTAVKELEDELAGLDS